MQMTLPIFLPEKPPVFESAAPALAGDVDLSGARLIKVVRRIGNCFKEGRTPLISRRLPVALCL